MSFGTKMSSEPIINSVGIPTAEFLQDVDAFMQKPENSSASEVIKRLDELYMKYKFMEQNLHLKKSKLLQQYPDIEKNLEILKTLKDKHTKNEEMDANYQLDYHLYTRAIVPPTDKVCLWLGANVMLEYSIQEAEELLNKNLAQAERSLKQIELDMDFLKDQITTTEVNMARVYNWDVRKRTTEQAPKNQTIDESKILE